jgi:hypothetical protein
MQKAHLLFAQELKGCLSRNRRTEDHFVFNCSWREKYFLRSEGGFVHVYNVSVVSQQLFVRFTLWCIRRVPLWCPDLSQWDVADWRSRELSQWKLRTTHETFPEYIVTCTAVAMQRPPDKAKKQRPFLGNSPINTFPLQRTRMRFSTQTTPRSYTQDRWSNVWAFNNIKPTLQKALTRSVTT